MNSKAAQFLLSVLLLLHSLVASARLTTPPLPDFSGHDLAPLSVADDTAELATFGDAIDDDAYDDMPGGVRVVVVVFADDPERGYVGIVGRSNNGAIWILYEGKLPLGLVPKGYVKLDENGRPAGFRFLDTYDVFYLGFDAAWEGETVPGWTMPVGDAPLAGFQGESIRMVMGEGWADGANGAVQIAPAVLGSAGNLAQVTIGAMLLLAPEATGITKVGGVMLITDAVDRQQAMFLRSPTGFERLCGTYMSEEEVRRATRFKDAGMILIMLGAAVPDKDLGDLRRWWNTGAENDAAWRALSVEDKLFYEIGQKTLPGTEFGKYSDLSAVARGRAIVADMGWFNALKPQGTGWRLGAGTTLNTGPTPLVRWAVPRATGAAVTGGVVWYLLPDEDDGGQ